MIWSPSTLTPTGDFNGDGLEDIIVGSPATRTANLDLMVIRAQDDSGRVDIISNHTALIDDGVKRLDDLTNLAIFSENRTLEFGALVTGLGNINGDGFHDVLTGGAVGRRHGLFGRPSLEQEELFLFQSPTTSNFQIESSSQFMFRTGDVGVGDFNGDGFDDILVEEFEVASNFVTLDRMEVVNRIILGNRDFLTDGISVAENAGVAFVHELVGNN